MLPYAVVCAAAFLTSGLTLFTGFGLGTLLMPVLALFFPLEMAVAATAVVHAANNAFKVAVVGRHADKSLIVRFGIPAIVAAFAGAAALGYVSHFGTLLTYTFGPRTAVVTPLKLVMGVLMLAFAALELLPRLREMRFDRRHLLVGGLLSGFFGGFSGHQGALRSAFLVKTGIQTQAFVGTNAAIGFLVDLARLTVYAITFLVSRSASPLARSQWPLIAAATLAAFAGVLVGKKFLHRVPLRTVQTLTGVLLGAIALAVASGIL